jgi:hypothetical protein
MNLNSRLVLVTVLGSTFFFSGDSSAQPPAECPASIGGIAECPNTGCGKDADSELNKAKNRTDIPGDPAVKHKTIASMRALTQPTRWNTGDDRTSIRTSGKEGTPVELNGFLLRAKPGSAESCNCDLTRRVDTDVHLVLVEAADDAEETSVTAEITPRIRANGHADWVFKNVNDLEGDFVRVTGWLMLDTKHIRQRHLSPTEARFNKGLKRATNWEVHPVTKLEVCQKSVTACKAGQGWEEFNVP